MFDLDAAQDISKTDAPKAPVGPLKIDWSLYKVAELVKFHDEIRRHLPPLSLSQMNLESELLLQFHTMRELQGEVLTDDDIPLNQRVQAANSVAQSLKTLIDGQEKVYTQERFKQIELLLIRELSKLPEESAAKFIEGYEALLTSMV